MWSNLATLGLLIVYLLVAMFRRPRHRPGQAHVTPKWVRVLERFVDDDRWFSIFALLLPVIVLILAFLSDWLHWGGAAIWTLTSVGAALYLCYLLMLTFVSGYRAILAVLSARERQLDQARREAAILQTGERTRQPHPRHGHRHLILHHPAFRTATG